MTAPTLHLDESGSDRLVFRDAEGRLVVIEKAFSGGFNVRPDDAPAVLSLIAAHLETEERFAN